MSGEWNEPFEPDEHTVALYHFDEGEGDEAHDACGDSGADVAVLRAGVVGQPSGLRRPRRGSNAATATSVWVP